VEVEYKSTLAPLSRINRTSFLLSMGSNFDFTDKTQETLAAAIQLAKDYANPQGVHSRLVRHEKEALDLSLFS
jgi:hypothetical protein